MLRALFREIVLIDNDMKRAAAEAQDIADANALARPARIWAGDYADAAAATIAVITAGAATHGTETRLSVAARSAVIAGRSEEHASELQSRMRISYAVFFLKTTQHTTSAHLSKHTRLLVTTIKTQTNYK